MDKRKKKTLWLVAAAFTLTMGLSVGSAMAYFTTYTAASGRAALELEQTVTIPQEEVADWTKHVTIENTGDVDCFVRVKAFAGEIYQDSLQYSDDHGKWTPGEDGYYYYSDVVPAKEEGKDPYRTEELRIHIDNMDREQSFNIILVQESTQVLYDEQGNPTADWNRIMDSDETVYAEEDEEQ